MNPSNRYYSQDQSIRFVMTTPEEETALFNWAKTGKLTEPGSGALLAGNRAFDDIDSPEGAREFLVRNHLLFAMTFAKQISKGNLPFNEVVSAANFAVVKAFESFKPDFGSRFTTYLRPFIFGEIQTLWRSKFNAFGVPDPSLQTESSRSVTIGWTTNSAGAGEMGSDTGGVMQTERGANEFLESRLGHEDHQGEELNLRDFNREQLGKILTTLGADDLELVHLHYFEGKSFAEIARARGITRKGVSIAHKRLLARLKKTLKFRVEEVL